MPSRDAPPGGAGGAARVTVVIPTFNRGALVARALRSVLSQEGARPEVVVVDDGSTDDTAAVVGTIADGDPRVRLVAQGRRGAQAARNAGIRAARGDWVAFLDSDDEYLPGSLSTRLAAAAESGVEVVHSECLVARGPGAAPGPFGVPPFAGDAYRDLLRGPGPMFQGLLARRSALEAVGGLDEGIVSYQEWDTSIRLARLFRFAFVPTPTFLYHRHGGETISGDRLREARGYEQVVRKHRAEIRRVLGRGALAEHYENAAALYRKAGAWPRARRCLLDAVANRPFGRSLFRRLGLLARGAG